MNNKKIETKSEKYVGNCGHGMSYWSSYLSLIESGVVDKEVMCIIIDPKCEECRLSETSVNMGTYIYK